METTLTRFKAGSMREIWALTWPLMLAYLSWSVMLFTDRWFLAQFDCSSFNASASGGMGYWLVAVIPAAIAGISEVIVGRFNGSNQPKSIGLVLWSSLLLSSLLIPVCCIIAYIGPYFLFNSPSCLEAHYFIPLIYFMPFQILTNCLNGFFVGIGRVEIITMTTLVGAIANIILDKWLIFGGFGVAPLGIIGAALGTGLSGFIQAAILTLAAFSHFYDKTYQTKIRPKWNELKPICAEFIKLGLPLGIGQWIETLGHFYFFSLTYTMGPEHVTLAALAQSFYLLLIFIGSAINKTAATICSNALGANKKHILREVTLNCLKLLIIFASLISLVCIFAPHWLLRHVLNPEDLNQFFSPSLFLAARWTLAAFSLFFLFDGINWILQGVLTSLGETKIIMWVNVLCYWLCVVLPLALLVKNGIYGAQWGWLLLALSAVLASPIFSLRLSQQLKKNSA